MKSHKSIALLLIVVTGIVSFWLYPGINKANTAKYERVYEDTFTKKSSLNSVSLESDTTIRRMSVKKPAYIRQELVPKRGVKKLEVEMFSRATHFVEPQLVLDDSLLIDSPGVVEEITFSDSAAVRATSSTTMKSLVKHDNGPLLNE
jgi:hypothetical protein